MPSGKSGPTVSDFLDFLHLLQLIVSGLESADSLKKLISVSIQKIKLHTQDTEFHAGMPFPIKFSQSTDSHSEGQQLS